MVKEAKFSVESIMRDCSWRDMIMLQQLDSQLARDDVLDRCTQNTAAKNLL